MAVLLVAQDREVAQQADRPTVALVLETLNSPFFIGMQRGAEGAAQRENVGPLVQAVAQLKASVSRMGSRLQL